MPWCKERDARILGLTLQLIGFVGLVLIYNRDAHKSEGISLQNWWRSQPNLRRKSVVAMTSAGNLTAKGTSTAYFPGSLGPNTPIDARVRMLEQDLQALREQMAIEVTNLKYGIQEANEIDRTNLNAIDTKLETLKNETRLSTSSNATLNLVAVTFFLAGVTIATLSPELATILGHDMSCLAPLGISIL